MKHQLQKNIQRLTSAFVKQQLTCSHLLLMLSGVMEVYGFPLLSLMPLLWAIFCTSDWMDWIASRSLLASGRVDLNCSWAVIRP